MVKPCYYYGTTRETQAKADEVGHKESGSCGESYRLRPACTARSQPNQEGKTRVERDKKLKGIAKGY